MASIITDQGILHFEVYGKGKPVILLPGWLGSWELWQDTMAFLGQYFRTYALDLWSSSEAGKKPSASRLSDFASQTAQFIEQMGITRAMLVGHGLGGTVTLLMALANPQRVERAAVISAPLHRGGLRFPLRLAARGPIASWLPSAFRLTRAFLRCTAPMLCRDPRLAEMMTRDLSPIVLRSFFTSLASLRMVDLRRELNRLDLPVLGMYADRDKIVSPRQWKALRAGAPHAQILCYSSAGHFIMLDDPRACMAPLKKFLEQSIGNQHE